MNRYYSLKYFILHILSFVLLINIVPPAVQANTKHCTYNASDEHMRPYETVGTANTSNYGDVAALQNGEEIIIVRPGDKFAPGKVVDRIDLLRVISCPDGVSFCDVNLTYVCDKHENENSERVSNENINEVTGESITPRSEDETDDSPYIVGPVILSDSDIGQVTRLLSEAAGGINIVTSPSAIDKDNSFRITVVFSHISFKNALQYLSETGNIEYKIIAGVYILVPEKWVENNLYNSGHNAPPKDNLPYFEGTLSLAETDIPTTMKLLSAGVGGVDIEVDSVVIEEGVTVSGSLRNIPLADALDVISYATGLKWKKQMVNGNPIFRIMK